MPLVRKVIIRYMCQVLVITQREGFTGKWLEDREKAIALGILKYTN